MVAATPSERGFWRHDDCTPRRTSSQKIVLSSSRSGWRASGRTARSLATMPIWCGRSVASSRSVSEKSPVPERRATEAFDEPSLRSTTALGPRTFVDTRSGGSELRFSKGSTSAATRQLPEPG